jgi:hypothetical protein
MEKALTSLEYQEYISLKNSIFAMKAQRSDLTDALYDLKKKLLFLEEEYDKLQESIDQKSDEFSSILESLGQKYELPQGVYNFSDTEPHYITLANQNVAA